MLASWTPLALHSVTPGGSHRQHVVDSGGQRLDDTQRRQGGDDVDRDGVPEVVGHVELHRVPAGREGHPGAPAPAPRRLVGTMMSNAQSSKGSQIDRHPPTVPERGDRTGAAIQPGASEPCLTHDASGWGTTSSRVRPGGGLATTAPPLAGQASSVASAAPTRAAPRAVAASRRSPRPDLRHPVRRDARRVGVADVYEVDAVDTPKSVVTDLHARDASSSATSRPDRGRTTGRTPPSSPSACWVARWPAGPTSAGSTSARCTCSCR